MADGWWARVGCLRRITIAARTMKTLLYWWYIISACRRGEFGGPWIDALFTGTLDADAHPYFAGIAHLRVSAHCLIRRDGEIVQYVPFDKRAWHAGVSSYHGRERCNDFSIGIELEGTDTQAYTEAQYQQLVVITQALIQRYPGIADNITGHCDIAPIRKTDPGPAFDWAKYRGMLAASSHKEIP
ncbi:1,6-anhydro-N-acetylmuramyl-L-alanine amidase AmpD [Klebsiella aerogenes MGH 77]|nr:1,6-anhydro-N-acetylmuramyl-L-alanine amidase AmpD [Klebsiella aerogenes MGH 77]